MQIDQMVGKFGFSGRIIDERHFSDIQGDQIDSQKGVTRSIIDELHSSDMIKWKVKVVLLEV